MVRLFSRLFSDYPQALPLGIILVLFCGITVQGSAAFGASGAVNVLTQHNDNSRTGANLNETILTTSNVNTNRFGKLFSRSVNGYIYAQPLYVAGLTVNGATHNVVYVVTMNNDVYAFDADDPQQSTPLWHVNLGPARTVNLKTGDFPGQQNGITSTPVIDPSSSTLYLVSNTNSNGSTFQLHALDLATGQEKLGGPTVIAPTYPGTGASAVNGNVTMNMPTSLQRPGLLLNSGKVYVAFASSGDQSPYHGWILAYNAENIAQGPYIFCTTPNGSEGGIWQGAGGLTADSAGNIYAATGNGTFDTDSTTVTGRDVGNSIIKLSSSLNLLSWFTPNASAADNSQDLDLGSSGLLAIPGSTSLICGGKTSVLYLVDGGNLGGYNSSADQNVQEVPLNAYHLHGGPVYWNSPSHGPTVYTWAEQDYLKAFSFSNGTLSASPTAQSAIRAPTISNDVYGAMPGGILSLSANGSTAGTGIVWANIPATTGHGLLPGMLRAFDADNLTNELWDSRQNASRDDYGYFGKFTAPTVVNGKVYVSTSSGALVVYGLLNGSLTGTVSATSATVNLTTVGTSDWAHWGLASAASYDHKAAGNSQISNKTTVGAATVKTYTNSSAIYSWNDGTPTGSNTGTGTGIYIAGTGSGFQFTAPADTTTRTLKVYVGAYHAQGQFTATLSDGSAAAFMDTSVNTTGFSLKVYTLTYKAGSAGQHLSVAWTLLTDHGGGNINFQAAALVAAAPPTTGSLTESVGSASAVNLTTEGTSDWAHWGLTAPTSYDHKAAGSGQITDKTVVGSGTVHTYSNNPAAFTWTDGTSTASASGTRTGVYVAGVSHGFQFTVPADTTSRTLRLYVGIYRGQGNLTAALSDGSAPVLTDTSVVETSGKSGGNSVLYSLTYNAASANQSLTVSWTLNADYGSGSVPGNVNLQAASLAPAGSN